MLQPSSDHPWDRVIHPQMQFYEESAGLPGMRRPERLHAFSGIDVASFGWFLPPSARNLERCQGVEGPVFDNFCRCREIFPHRCRLDDLEAHLWFRLHGRIIQQCPSCGIFIFLTSGSPEWKRQRALFYLGVHLGINALPVRINPPPPPILILPWWYIIYREHLIHIRGLGGGRC